MGITCFRYKQGTLKVALISKNIVPNVLLIAQNDLCEIIVKSYQSFDLDKTDSNRKLEEAVQKFMVKRNKQIERSNEKMNQI